MLIKRLSVLAVATSLVACASTTAQKAETVAPAPVTRVVEIAPQVVPVHPYAMPARQARVVPQSPEWYVRMPEDTPDMTFAVGTATSTDEQMAYDKARMAAERKLVEQMYARITTQTNNFRSDRGQTLVENFQQVTRKNARGELSGAQRVDSQVTHDGSYYKVYVLLRLPAGTANTMQTRRDQQRLQRESDIRSRAAERNMDANETANTQRELDADRALERSVTPQSRVEPVVVPEKPTESVPTAQGEIKLLDVDNVEYKRRRDEALAKPGAVVGQITLR
jgi:hypothetical protein